MDPKQKQMEILSYLVVGTFVMALVALIFVPIPSASKDVLLVLLGALVVQYKDTYSYYFGSSKSSADKTELMNQQSQPKE